MVLKKEPFSLLSSSLPKTGKVVGSGRTLAEHNIIAVLRENPKGVPSSVICQLTGHSANTVRKVLELLIAEGLAEDHKGTWTFTQVVSPTRLFRLAKGPATSTSPSRK